MSFQRETGRLILRDVRESDIPILLEQYAEIEARENILSSQWDRTFNKKSLVNAIVETKRRCRRERYELAVILKGDKSLIGSCSISSVKSKSFETVVGWHFGHAFAGNGYATEAARELLRIGFELNNVSEIYADCFVGNRASIRIMEKIGMTSRPNLELFNQIRSWSYGESKPAVRYVISRRQWLAKQCERLD